MPLRWKKFEAAERPAIGCGISSLSFVAWAGVPLPGTMASESVVQLGYGLTPHITMAYFRPGTYSMEQVQRLSAVLRDVEMGITLNMKDLVLQVFTDMNHYETVL